MRKFDGNLRLIFSEGNIKITKDENNQFMEKYSHMNDDGTIDLDLDNTIHLKILDIYMTSDQIVLNGIDYRIISRNFSEVEPALYLQLEIVNK